jgi:hypothetical protein
MITLRCPRCGETYYAEESSIGKFIRCTAKRCNTLIEVKPQKDQPEKPDKRAKARSGKPSMATLRTPWKAITFSRRTLKLAGVWAVFLIVCGLLIKYTGLVSPLLFLSAVGWRYAKSKTGLWFPTVEAALRATTWGLAVAVLLLLVLSDYERIAPTSYPTMFQNIGDGIVGMVIMIGGLINFLNIFIYAALVGLFIALHRFAPNWSPMRPFARLRGRLTALSLVLVGIGAFGAFGGDRIGYLVESAEHQLSERHFTAQVAEQSFKRRKVLAQSLLVAINDSNGIGVKDKRYYEVLFGHLLGEPQPVRKLRFDKAEQAAVEDSDRLLLQTHLAGGSGGPPQPDPVTAWTVSRWFGERDQTAKQEANVDRLKLETDKAVAGVIALVCAAANLSLAESKDICRIYVNKVLDKYADAIPDDVTPDQLHLISKLTFAPTLAIDIQAKALEGKLDYARGLMKSRKWKEAINELTDIHDRHSETAVGKEALDLIPECHFLMAEDDFADHDYDSAAEQFDMVASNYPESPRVPAARNKGIEAEVLVIKNGKHDRMPPVTVDGKSGIPGKSVIEIRNDSGYHLTVLYGGPDSQQVVLDPNAHGTITIKSGSYIAAASVDLFGVTPQYGERQFNDVHVREVIVTK